MAIDARNRWALYGFDAVLIVAFDDVVSVAGKINMYEAGDMPVVAISGIYLANGAGGVLQSDFFTDGSAAQQPRRRIRKWW